MLRAWQVLHLGMALLVPLSTVAAAELEVVRLGVDAERTRVVLETTRSVAAAIEQTQEGLEVTVPAALGPNLTLDRPRGVVATLVAEALGNGRARLNLGLKAPVRVVAAFALEPGASGLYRFVIDLAQPPSSASVAATSPTRIDGPARPPRRRPAAEVAVAVPPAPPIVVIDAGHGGVDPGAIGASGLREKDVTLTVALLLQERLLARGGIDVVLTRTEDRSLTLARRREIAVEAAADLLVSLHADSLPDQPQVRGASVYTLSPQPSDPEAARRAQEENAADDRLRVIAVQEDETVRAILTSIMRTSTTRRSIAAADALTGGLGEVTPLVNRARRSANFTVLRSLHTPSVLVELGYLSNTADEHQLADANHLGQLAAALDRAVTAYLGMN